MSFMTKCEADPKTAATAKPPKRSWQALQKNELHDEVRQGRCRPLTITARASRTAPAARPPLSAIVRRFVTHKHLLQRIKVTAAAINY
jgi:hypothetical protein